MLGTHDTAQEAVTQAENKPTDTELREEAPAGLREARTELELTSMEARGWISPRMQATAMDESSRQHKVQVRQDKVRTGLRARAQ